MKNALLLLLLALWAICSFPQTASTAKPSSPDEDYSGMYSFLREGEFVQLNMHEKGRVTGFVSRYGDLDSDRGAFLDQFIKQGSLSGHNLTFATETLHGVWFEFRGIAKRGSGKTPGDEGYYILKGTLIEHKSAPKQGASAESREVLFKSFPQDLSGEPAKQKD